MSNPYTPDDWKVLIPNPSGSQCDEFKKVLLQFPEQFYLWYKWAFNSDGTYSTENATAICTALSAIGCSSGGSSSSTTTTSGTGSTTTTTTAPASAVVWAITADNGGALTPNKFITVDLANGAVSVISTASSYFYCLGERPTTGVIYGYVLNGANIDFVSVNKVTGAETVIAASVAMPAAPQGMAFDSSGICYVTIETAGGGGGCAGNGAVYTVNLATGVPTSIGSHSSWGISEIAFIGSTLYGIGQEACFTDKRICTINLSTGAVTTVAALDPSEPVPNSFEDKLAYVNSILYKVEISTISQINQSTGAVINVATFNNTLNGRIKGMALLQ
jgi:hypothetical protein